MIKAFMEGRVAANAKVFEYGNQNRAKTGVTFGLICNKFYKDEDPTYMQCTIWGADEKTAQYITTGKQLVVTGDITRNKDGYYSISVTDWASGLTPKSDQNSADSLLPENTASLNGNMNIPNGIDDELAFN